MKHLIITTIYGKKSDIWGTAQGIDKWKQDDSGNKLSCKIAGNAAIVLKQKDESMNVPKAVDLTTQCVEEAKKIINGVPEDEDHIFLAAHGKTFDQITQWLKSENKKVVANFFSHEKSDELFETLKIFAANPSAENFGLVCEEIEKKKTDNLIGHLQHKFNRILTPILIDFQGLEETSYNEDYWKEIVEDYRQRADAPFIELKNLEDDIDKKIVAAPPLAEEQSVKEVIAHLKKYPEKASVLKCLVKETGVCPTNVRCEADAYDCVSGSSSKSGVENKVEELFEWAKEMQRITDEIING